MKLIYFKLSKQATLKLNMLKILFNLESLTKFSKEIAELKTNPGSDRIRTHAFVEIGA